MIELPRNGSTQSPIRATQLSRALKRALKDRSASIELFTELEGPLRQCLELTERSGAREACIACQRAIDELVKAPSGQKLQEILSPLISWLETRTRLV